MGMFSAAKPNADHTASAVKERQEARRKEDVKREIREWRKDRRSI